MASNNIEEANSIDLETVRKEFKAIKLLYDLLGNINEAIEKSKYLLKENE
jgi:hypothetical protein